MGGRRDECGDAGIEAHSRPRNIIFVRMTRAGIYSRTNCPCRLVPAHQGMKSGSCGLVQRIGAADSATPHPDPSGGQAPALHFLIPPSTIGLQFGTLRRWRAGIEVDWRAHPGSESGTCFRTNDEFGGGNHSFSHQSLILAGVGTPWCENRGVDKWSCLRVICHPYTSPGFPLSRE